MSTRSVKTTATAQRLRVGNGLSIRRPFPVGQLEMLDPFLVFDELGPVEFGPGEAKGASDHPHRGFEAITYVLEGMIEHRDSAGNQGIVGAGGVQWMTAGSGIVHSELPPATFQNSGGRAHGFRVWLNLPSRHKMVRPKYQQRDALQIPTAVSRDGRATVSVIAGHALGVASTISTHSPVHYHHWRLRPGASVETPVPETSRAFVYVFKGSAFVGREKAKVDEGQLAVFGPGSRIPLSTPHDATNPAELLLLAGQPVGEPVARYGPFVMNNRQEIRDAIADYRAGKMGRIKPGPPATDSLLANAPSSAATSPSPV